VRSFDIAVLQESAAEAEALAAADDERDAEVPRLSRSGLRALADHAADEP
jgi:hypothetical protein